MTPRHLQWLRTLQNGLLWWLVTDKESHYKNCLYKLNDEFDPADIDRTLEMHEALNAFKERHPEANIEAPKTEAEYMLEEFKEYLEEEPSDLSCY